VGFVPSTANYGCPQNGNIGLEEQNLNDVDHHLRRSICSVI
jgi:hypothetical protein